MREQIIISVHQGLIICESRPANIEVVLYDYDINEIEEGNPDREYGKDELGDYEVIEL